jgi:deoxyhypusine monooxygenase
MVRHEAAEALGALSSVQSLDLLKKYKTDESRSVRETCEIAVDKIEYDHFTEEGRARQLDPNFPTTDPAPASLPTEDESTSSLRSTLLDTSIPLFKRYRAMFALRNIVARSSGVKGKEDEARAGVQALADGFKDGSALFRHEIAYIFGQLSSPYSIPSLLYVMRDSAEDDMVRHEAAEALGGIASEGDEGVEGELYENEEDKQKGVLGILREWSTLESAPPVVRESCQVALDMYEYENSNQFQYADGLKTDDSAPVEQTPAQRLTGMDRGVDLTSIMA